MLASVINQIARLSNAVYGLVAVGPEDNLRSRVRRLARSICGRTQAPPPVREVAPPPVREVSQEKRQELTHVRKLLGHHPYDSEVNPEGKIPANTNWVDCDRIHSQWARRVTGKMYSEEILIEFIPAMRSAALEVIKNKICVNNNSNAEVEIDDNDFNPFTKRSKAKQEPLRHYCRVVGEALMTLDLGEGFEQGFLKNMDLIPQLILRAIKGYSDHPQLQENAYREIQRLASRPEVLNKEVLGMVLESLRMDPPAAQPRRGGNEVNVHEYGWDEDVVGPDPRTVNPHRYKKELSRPLRQLPGFPFGGGPNTCPGTRIIKFVPVQFLIVLLSHYRIEPSTNYEHRFSIHHYRFIPRTSD